MPICGDGVVEGSEQCDDGNMIDTDGCRNNCTIPPPPLCTTGGANNEPDILIGYAPAMGASVGSTGQIKVWVNDECAPKIAPNEVVDPATGAITTPGDRTAKAPDGYLWEPALYIAPQSAEDGGTPHFPQMIKGAYNNMPVAGQCGFPGSMSGGMEPPPAGTMATLPYSVEYVWNVADLGLMPGGYLAEFVIHDGDRDRGVGCVSIVIQ
jgi:cysteine-rich repeat protein